MHRGSALGRLLKVLRPSDESLGQGSLQARTGSIVVDVDAQGATTARRADILLHTSHSRPGQGGPPAAAVHGAALALRLMRVVPASGVVTVYVVRCLQSWAAVYPGRAEGLSGLPAAWSQLPSKGSTLRALFVPGLQLAVWGSLDPVSGRVDMTLGLPDTTLRLAGLRNVPDGAMLPVRISGASDKPSVDFKG